MDDITIYPRHFVYYKLTNFPLLRSLYVITSEFFQHQTPKPTRIMAFRIGIAVALVLVFISAVAAFAPRRQLAYDASATFYNGSETFDATVIMISLDGFRADYLDRGNTPTLSRLGRLRMYLETWVMNVYSPFELDGMDGLANEGIKAPYMNPCFPVCSPQSLLPHCP